MELFTITRHCKERYAERIMGRSNPSDVAVYVAQNESKISDDINTMLTYSELIFTGHLRDRSDEALRDNKEVNVYLCNTWVLLTDKANQKVITLYKIDFHLGEEFNKQYVSLKKEAIDQAKAEFEKATNEYNEYKQQYEEIIDECENKISSYKELINKLNNQKEAYQKLIDNGDLQVKESREHIKEMIADLVCKKEF